MFNFLHSPKDTPDDPLRSGPDWLTKQDLLALEKRIMAMIDDLTQDVQAQTTVVASVTTLLASLSQQLAAAGTDPVKLAALKTQIDTNTASLSAAVVANTAATSAT